MGVKGGLGFKGPKRSGFKGSGLGALEVKGLLAYGLRSQGLGLRGSENGSPFQVS